MEDGKWQVGASHLPATPPLFSWLFLCGLCGLCVRYRLLAALCVLCVLCGQKWLCFACFALKGCWLFRPRDLTDEGRARAVPPAATKRGPPRKAIRQAPASRKPKVESRALAPPIRFVGSSFRRFVLFPQAALNSLFNHKEHKEHKEQPMSHAKSAKFAKGK